MTIIQHLTCDYRHLTKQLSRRNMEVFWQIFKAKLLYSLNYTFIWKPLGPSPKQRTSNVTNFCLIQNKQK